MTHDDTVRGDGRAESVGRPDGLAIMASDVAASYLIARKVTVGELVAALGGPVEPHEETVNAAHVELAVSDVLLIARIEPPELGLDLALARLGAEDSDVALVHWNEAEDARVRWSHAGNVVAADGTPFEAEASGRLADALATVDRVGGAARYLAAVELLLDVDVSFWSAADRTTVAVAGWPLPVELTPEIEGSSLAAAYPRVARMLSRASREQLREALATALELLADLAEQAAAAPAPDLPVVTAHLRASAEVPTAVVRRVRRAARAFAREHRAAEDRALVDGTALNLEWNVPLALHEGLTISVAKPDSVPAVGEVLDSALFYDETINGTDRQELLISALTSRRPV